MEPHLQRVEVEASRGRDHDLAVDDAIVRQLLEQRIVQLGKVAIERPQIAALDVEVVAAAEHDRAESVPLRLVQVRSFRWERLGQLRKHRLHWRVGPETGKKPWGPPAPKVHWIRGA